MASTTTFVLHPPFPLFCDAPHSPLSPFLFFSPGLTQPSPGEHHRAQRFLTSLGDWLWQKKWVPLPQTVEEEEGIDALVHAMERVRVSVFSNLRFLGSSSDADAFLFSIFGGAGGDFFADSRDVGEDARCEDWEDLRRGFGLRDSVYVRGRETTAPLLSFLQGSKEREREDTSPSNRRKNTKRKTRRVVNQSTTLPPQVSIRISDPHSPTPAHFPSPLPHKRPREGDEAG